MNNFEKIKAGDFVKDSIGRYGIVVHVHKSAVCGVSEVSVYMAALGYKITYWADALWKVA